jgi:hypothetical protein
MTDARQGSDSDYLRSRLDILDCINKYARGVDRLDQAVLMSAFHDDATLDYGVFVGTPAQFAEYFFDFHRRHQSATFHNITNHVCELDGDSAHTETYYVYASNNLAAPLFTLAGGRYIDRFERRAGRWAIATRKCIGGWGLPGQDSEILRELGKGFAEIGHISRDSSDVSYERPLTVRPDRHGKTRRI